MNGQTFQLLRRVLALEEQQGYRNASATGGLFRYFSQQFAKQGDETTVVQELLSDLRTYENLATVQQRREQLQIVLAHIESAHESPIIDITVEPPPSKPTPEARVALARDLSQPLHEVFTIRKQELEKLGRIGIATVEDALYYFPRDHYDYRNPLPINKLHAGAATTLIGTLQGVDVRRTAQKHTIVEARISDATALIRVGWFNQQHMARLLRPRIGQRIAVSGHAEIYNGRLRFVPRDYEFPDEDDATHTARLVPIYALTEGLTQRWLRSTIRRALGAGLSLLRDPLPIGLRGTFDLLGLAEAIGSYHFPADEIAKGKAVRRLAFDELLYISIGMARRKREWQQGDPAHAIRVDTDLVERFKSSLPYTLTSAQQRVIDSLSGSISQAVPMSCLLQGDVGSGKTVVAAALLLQTAAAGWQSAMMAPTAILAEQHARSLGDLLAPFDVGVALLTGAVTGKERASIYERVSTGEVAVVVGTHALIQEGVLFDRMALAVIDEQHRFGVEQRAALRQKGFSPHVLAMTATPIPRTLSLTLYGDLDVDVLDERPPGRQPIETSWVTSEKEAMRRIQEQIAAGHQAYVICPLVEEQDGADENVKAAVAEQRRLQRDVFMDRRVGLLHGKMKATDKESALAAFRDGEIDVLVATSVVEVGIDVPNATIMVILEAQRFGLAQLHQLRGRVGRGSARSYCLLVADQASEVSRQRIQAIIATDDGFALAEEDLRLRGPGEFWGTRQSGLPALKMAGLGDMRTISDARLAADTVLSADPDLSLAEHAELAVRVQRFWNRGVEAS